MHDQGHHKVPMVTRRRATEHITSAIVTVWRCGGGWMSVHRHGRSLDVRNERGEIRTKHKMGRLISDGFLLSLGFSRKRPTPSIRAVIGVSTG